MKKISYLLALFFVASVIFISCRNDDDDNDPAPSVTDEGVLIGEIDGTPIRWATRNVAAPGTFAPYPHSAGMFFQWNRRTGISATTPGVGVEFPNWNATQAEGTTWARANDPCPQGWRVPTAAELYALSAAGSEWTNRSGVNGSYFGIGANRIFLPASGLRGGFRGDMFHVGMSGIFWSSTEDGSELARCLNFDSGGVRVSRRFWRSVGGSVRCVAE